jgi:hypothetical protein
MTNELPLLLAEIRELTGERTAAMPGPRLTEMENTLTSGYARALALEGERWRIERQIADLAARIADREQAGELRDLVEALSRADAELSRLRRLLGLLREHVDLGRAVQRVAAEA